jgi:hypothetical protein
LHMKPTLTCCKVSFSKDVGTYCSDSIGMDGISSTVYLLGEFTYNYAAVVVVVVVSTTTTIFLFTQLFVV